MLIDLPKSSILVNVEGKETVPSNSKTTLTLTDAPLYIISDCSPETMEKALKNSSMSLPELQVEMSQINSREIAVYLNNLTAAPLKVNCALNGKNAAQTTIPAQGIKSIIIPADKKSNTADLTVTTAKGFTYAQKETLENIHVKRTKSMADLKKSAPVFVLDKAELHLNNIDFAANRHYNGREDCSVEVRMGYDADNLYMNVKVNDDIHVNEQTRRFMTWAGDCIQFAFDSNHDAKLKKMQGKSTICDDDLLFTAALVGTEQRLICETAPNAEKVNPAYKVTRDDKNKVTEFDITIPLKQIPSLKVKPGTVFGFNLIALDCDAKGGTSQYWMQLTPGIASGQKPYLFKGFIFE